MYHPRWPVKRPLFQEYGFESVGGHLDGPAFHSPHMHYHCQRGPPPPPPPMSPLPSLRADWSSGSVGRPIGLRVSGVSGGASRRWQPGVKRNAASDDCGGGGTAASYTPERQLKRGRTSENLGPDSGVSFSGPRLASAAAGCGCTGAGSPHCQLSQPIEKMFRACRQTDTLYQKKLCLRDRLYDLLSGCFERYELHIVGSSCTGFALNSSDMDLCLYLFESWVDQRFRAKQILARVKTRLSADGDFGVHLITAKVPILRFNSQCTGVQVDLNCNSVVGIRNTHLLQCYAALDQRVSRLIVIVKLWAQSHDINDASRCTLSSYTLVLLVIHFLQCGVDPPVLPNLQRLYRDKFLPDRPIHQISKQNRPDSLGGAAAGCDDDRVCHAPSRSRNQLCVGRLFADFVHYYAHEFHFDKHVASVRTGTRLYKYQCVSSASRDHSAGCWRFVCVEEPFTRTNTARAVHSAAAFDRITAVFQRSADRLRQLTCVSSGGGGRQLVSLFGDSVSPPVRQLLALMRR